MLQAQDDLILAQGEDEGLPPGRRIVQHGARASSLRGQAAPIPDLGPTALVGDRTVPNLDNLLQQTAIA